MRRSWLKQHLKTHLAQGEKSLHPCEVCQERFTRRSDVLRHRAVVHRGERPFRCERCGKSYANKTLLRIHSATHDNKV